MDVTVEQFPHLSGLDLAGANDSSDNLPISILIGADCYWKIATGRIIHGSHTKLGWRETYPLLPDNFDLSKKK